MLFWCGRMRAVGGGAMF